MSKAKAMSLELNTPADIYQRINEELACIVDSLHVKSNDASLAQAQDEAFNLLTQHQAELQTQLAELEKNSEWKTFTIGNYSGQFRPPRRIQPKQG